MAKIEGELATALGILRDYFEGRRISFALVGALVPVLLLSSDQSNLEIGARETRDADHVIKLPSWEAWEAVLADLVNLGFRRAEGEQEHRLYYGAAEIDLIPFGVMKSSEEPLVWPDSGNTMNMTGFADVFRYAVRTEVTPGITLPVAPLWLLAVLKVSAYLDRRFSRDLTDLIFVLENYESADGSNRRFDILDEKDVTYEVSGALLVGRDIRNYASAQPITLMKQFLKEIGDEYHQVINRILQGEERTFSESRREAVFKLVKALRKGLA